MSLTRDDLDAIKRLIVAVLDEGDTPANCCYRAWAIATENDLLDTVASASQAASTAGWTVFDWQNPATHPPYGQLVLLHLDVDSYEYTIAKLVAIVDPDAAADMREEAGWAPLYWVDQAGDHDEFLSDQDDRIAIAWTPIPPALEAHQGAPEEAER